MALPGSGQISLNDVNIELGISPGTLISLNDSAVRTLFGVPSGTISLSNGYGKSNSWTGSATVSANTNDYNMRSAAITAGWPGSVDATFTVTINPGVYVNSTSTGTAAFSVGSPWPAGSSLTLVNNGIIVGRGGDGGQGGDANASYPSGKAGEAGGPAFNTGRQITVTNSGTIAGGGGGGGGGGLSWWNDKGIRYRTGGGGGGGIGVSSGGLTGQNTGKINPALVGLGSPGTGGTLTTAGSGGAGGTIPGPAVLNAGPGGPGGGNGSAGSNGTNDVTPGGPGGAAGAAVIGNPFITWPSFGTRSGPIS